MATAKHITIIGATGNLGVPVTKNLLSFGFDVKLVVRNRAKARKLFGTSENIQIIEANLTDMPALKGALSDTEYLYLNLSTHTTQLQVSFATEREGVANILEAINKAKIKQIIAISGLGALDNNHKVSGFEFIPNIIRKQGQKLIKASGIPYTFLHCTWFADSFIIYSRNNTYAVIGDTENPIFFTNCYDYTRHLVKAIGNPDAFYKEFPVQGEEGLSHPEAAKRFLSIYSQSTKVKPLPGWILNILAPFKKEMKFLKHMSDYFSQSNETFLPEECGTYKTLGRPTQSLRQYARKVKREAFYDYLFV